MLLILNSLIKLNKFIIVIIIIQEVKTELKIPLMSILLTWVKRETSNGLKREKYF